MLRKGEDDRKEGKEGERGGTVKEKGGVKEGRRRRKELTCVLRMWSMLVRHGASSVATLLPPRMSGL